MKSRAFRITTAAALILFPILLLSMSWPCENAVLASNFGANDRGRPILGMVFTGDTEVLAAEKGEVIFSRSANDASRLPSPLGAWSAVDHGDGLISIYSRYADKGPVPSQVEKGQPIASSGISGWSAQRGFYFIVYDRRERRWINPAVIITPLRDVRPPQIFSVELRNAQGAVVRSLTQGRYTVVVNTSGFAPARAGMPPHAPQRIVSSVNGAEVGSLNFEAVSARDGVLMVYRNGLVPAKQIFANSPAFESAEVFLNRGQVNLEIIVQDALGNSRSYVNRLFVN
jgi:hypothetical protein